MTKELAEEGMTEYKVRIGLQNTRIINGKEVFVDTRGKPTESNLIVAKEGG